MTDFSRRSILKSSPLAAMALCMPKPWSQALSLDVSPPTSGTGWLTRAVVEEFLEAIRQSRAFTLGCAMAMPEDRYGFRPVPEVRSFGQQLVHIAQANGAIMESHVEGKKDPSWPYSGDGNESVTSKADVIAQLKASYDYDERALSHMTDDMLRDRVKAETGEHSRHWGLHFLLDHATHHRGQAVVYLRLNGIKPPEYQV